VSHGPSPVAGHGTGVTILLSGPDTVLRTVRDAAASLAPSYAILPGLLEVHMVKPSTFSVVARDPLTGDLGVAVQSKFLAVGAVVPFAWAGMGAIATQALCNVAYGPQGLALLAGGMPARDVLASSFRSMMAPNAGRRQSSTPVEPQLRTRVPAVAHGPGMKSVRDSPVRATS
jgi:hypothetical protein